MLASQEIAGLAESVRMPVQVYRVLLPPLPNEVFCGGFSDLLEAGVAMEGSPPPLQSDTSACSAGSGSMAFVMPPYSGFTLELFSVIMNRALADLTGQVKYRMLTVLKQ